MRAQKFIADTNASRSFKLKKFTKFDSAAAAVEEATSLVESKVTPRLASLLDVLKDEKKASLAVADPKLGMSIYKMENTIATNIHYV